MRSSVKSNFSFFGGVVLGITTCLTSFSGANAAPQAGTPVHVLGLFSASYDAAHINYAHELNRFFPKFASQNGFTYDSSKNWDLLSDPVALAAKYQVVMFIDDQPYSGNQRTGFQKYMENGGGFIGFHVSAFCTNSNEWEWYHTTFLGSGAFRSNTWGPTPATMKVEDSSHSVTKGFPLKFKSETSEWYNWNNDLRKNPNIKVLCSIDPSSYPLGTDPNQSWTSGDNPIVWTNTKFKMIYCNSGHNDMDYAANTAKSNTFDNAQHCTLIANAINWIGGKTVTSIHGKFENAPNYHSDMEIDFNSPRLTVSRGGISDFGVSILDLQGNRISGGRTSTGIFSIDKDKIGKGFYLIRSDSPRGNASQSIRLP
jgi:type 1 glutamine amidotransferase